MRANRLLLCVFASFAVLVIAGFVDVLSQAVNPGSQSALPSGTTPALPAAVRPVTDDYYGTKVADPYRYMENLSDPEVQSWMKAQNDYTRAALAAISGREQLLTRIRNLDQSAPQVQTQRLPGDQYLLLKMLPSENTPKLYLRRGLNGQDRLLVDPEKITLAPADQGKGTNVIFGLAVSNNGEYIALGIEPGGDELHGELHVIDAGTGLESGDVITQVGAEEWQPYWLPDDRSFVYGRLQELPPGAPAAEMRQKFRSYLHVLGTKSEKDQPVFGYGVVPSIDVDPSLIASVRTQPASRWALGILNGSTTPNSAYYIESVTDLGKANTMWRKVADFSDGVTDITVHNDDLYLLTYKNAPRYEVIRIDARKPDLASAETVVPPGQAVVTSIHSAQDALYVQLLDGGLSRVLRVPYGPHPQVQTVVLPLALSGNGHYGLGCRRRGSWFAHKPQIRFALTTKPSVRQAIKTSPRAPTMKGC